MNFKSIVSVVLVSALTLTSVATVASIETACTPAQQAVTTQIENVVLDDLKAGKTLVQIEDDVAALVLPGQPGADLVAIVNAAITLLLNLTGIVPPNLIPTATAMQTELAAKHIAGMKR